MFEYIDDIISDAFSPFYAKRLSFPLRTDEVRSAVDGDQLKISLDVPGVKKEDVDITFESGNVVKITAKRADLNTTSTWRYLVSDAWDRESADAKLEDGVLTILLIKKERDKTRRLLVK